MNSVLFLFFIPYICFGKDFTVVVLPDTQYYSSFFDETFYEQTHWICQCSEEKNVVFTSHLGDIVHRKNQYPADWKKAGNALSTLEKCGIPVGFIPGNHDVEKGKDYKYFDETFPADYYADKTWFGGSFDPKNARNSYHLFSGSGNYPRFISIHMEYLFSKEVILWASELLNNHSDRIALLSTHYSGSDCSDRVYDPIKTLIRENCNVLMTFGGHVFECGGERTIPIVNRCNETSYVMVSNYQDRKEGGTGWLRYYTFQRDKICAFTYSPQLHSFELDKNSHFSIDRRHMSLQEGCEAIECGSRYVSPGFVLGSVWIATTNILFLFVTMWKHETIRRIKGKKNSQKIKFLS